MTTAPLRPAAEPTPGRPERPERPERPVSTATAAAVEPGTLRLGTRASLLARTQSEQVADLVRERLGVTVELVEVRTDGDRSQALGTPLETAGGTGIFVSALRDALLAGEVDLAVHSLKDLPTGAAPGIALAAVPPRADVRDAVVARDGLTLGELPAGSRIGTGSPRRAAQLHALGLGLDVVGIRGNVDTRLRKVGEGVVDAVVLARAGLARIDRADVATEVLDPLLMLPAPGQGALAVECRAADTALVDALRDHLDDAASRTAVEAERALLAALEAGCSAPIGALAEVVEGDDGDELWLRAVALSTDGLLAVRGSASGPVGDPLGLGRRLAAQLVEDGADRLVPGLPLTPDHLPDPQTDPATDPPTDHSADSPPDSSAPGSIPTREQHP